MIHRLMRGACLAALSLACLPAGALAHGGVSHDPVGEAHAKKDLAGVSMREIERNADPKAGKRSSTLARRAAVGPLSTVGSWGSVLPMPVVPVFTAQLPNGKVLMWDSVGDNAAETYLDHTYTRAAVWDPTTNTSRRVDVKGYNIFCSGFTHLPNGNVVVAGGNANFLLQGTKTTHVFDWRTETWSRGPDMADGRWYPSMVSQADGSALIVGGGPKVGELYRETGGRPSLTQLGGILTHSSRYYPYMHLAPDGSTQYSDELSTGGAFSIADDGSVTFPGQTINAFADYGSFAPFTTGKTVYAGGGYGGSTGTAVVDTTSGRPVMRTTAPMSTPRRQHTMTTLADGSVVVTGGLSQGNLVELDHAVYEAERWDPATERWSRLAGASVARQYHSTGMLLPDGRVFTGGGGICNECMAHKYLRRDAEIFTPPYLYRRDGSGRLADRPEITTAPTTVAYGSSFQVRTPQAASIAKVGLVRLGAVTHGANQDQRYVPLDFTGGRTNLGVSTPNNPFEAPPGYYMLFIVDSEGVPSVSKMITVAAPAVPSSAAPQPNLVSQPGVVTTGSLPCLPSQNALKAVNGSVRGGQSDKWCSFMPTKQLDIDLGTTRTIGEIVISHAQAGGESAAFNTRAYELAVSTDKRTWSVVSNTTVNTAAVTTHRFAPRSARYLRLVVTKPTQGLDPSARIYEVEAFAGASGSTPLAREDVQGAVALYPDAGQSGEPQRLELGQYAGARGNLGIAGPVARSVDVAAGYRATVCGGGGACVSLPAGRHELAAPVAGAVTAVTVSPA